jgi:hypothetical protein
MTSEEVSQIADMKLRSSSRSLIVREALSKRALCTWIKSPEYKILEVASKKHSVTNTSESILKILSGAA